MRSSMINARNNADEALKLAKATGTRRGWIAAEDAAELATAASEKYAQSLSEEARRVFYIDRANQLLEYLSAK